MAWRMVAFCIDDVPKQAKTVGSVFAAQKTMRAPVTSGREELQPRNVEGKRGDGHENILGNHAGSLFHRGEEIDQGAVFDLDALGHAGRAGSVDQVGQIIGDGAASEDCPCFRRRGGTFGVEIEHRRARGR